LRSIKPLELDEIERIHAANLASLQPDQAKRRLCETLLHYEARAKAINEGNADLDAAATTEPSKLLNHAAGPLIVGGIVLVKAWGQRGEPAFGDLVYEDRNTMQTFDHWFSVTADRMPLKGDRKGIYLGKGKVLTATTEPSETEADPTRPGVTTETEGPSFTGLQQAAAEKHGFDLPKPPETQPDPPTSVGTDPTAQPDATPGVE
jgi:hypothetical protein